MPAGKETTFRIGELPGGERSDGRRRERREAAPAPLELVGVLLRPEQHTALAREARHRALVRASVVTDEGELIREALDAWLAGRR